MRRASARVLVVLLAVLGALTVAGPASAHVGGGAAGSDFDGRVTSVTPDLPGITVRVLQFGDELELVNRSGTEAVGRVAVALLVSLGAGFVVGGIAAVRRFREVAAAETVSPPA